MSSSPVYYPEFIVQTPQAGLLDISNAIGASRQAERSSLPASSLLLKQAAQIFSPSPALIHHTVRTTGLPYTVVAELLADIPRWLNSVPEQLAARFTPAAGQPGVLLESLPGGELLAHTPPPGYCYAVLPGADPRAAALVLANLICLGIPVILKASRYDAVTPAILGALLEAGLDPNFASLLYFSNHGPEAVGMHQRLVVESAVLWTFGPRQLADRALRYRLQPTNQPDDLFAGKTVLYHDYAACAALIKGRFSAATRQFLRQSLSFASGCTAARVLFLIDQEDWIDQAASALEHLRVGDPLDPDTEVGYIHPTNLDSLQALMQRFAHRLHAFGGERRSQCQMTPLLLDLQEPIPELLGEEIPAYFLAAWRCRDFSDALKPLNHTQNGLPRLAVSLVGFGDDLPGPGELAQIHARTILRDRPTSTVFPFFHEGHDYVRLLTTTTLMSLGSG